MGDRAGQARVTGCSCLVRRAPARAPVRLTAAVLVALVAALSSGGCGDDGDDCSHCCACECTGALCTGETQYLESSKCLDCAEACPTCAPPLNARRRASVLATMFRPALACASAESAPPRRTPLISFAEAIIARGA